jgi:hypothetical protein
MTDTLDLTIVVISTSVICSTSIFNSRRSNQSASLSSELPPECMDQQDIGREH